MKSHQAEYCKTCCLFFQPEKHNVQRCADRHCMSPCCPSADVETPTCTVMCRRHVRAWEPKKCHSEREVGQVEDGLALWSYLKRLYQDFQSPGATATPCPCKSIVVSSSPRLIWLNIYAVHSPQPNVPLPNDEQVPPNATCSKCVTLEGLEIENLRLKMALENANQRAAQLQGTVVHLRTELAWLQPAIPNVPQPSMPHNASPTTPSHGMLAISPVLGTKHDDTRMDQDDPARDSGYASAAPVAACLSGDKNPYSNDHLGITDEMFDAPFDPYDPLQMPLGMYDNEANDDALYMRHPTEDGGMFPMELDFAAPANTQEMQLQQSSLSLPHCNQYSRAPAQEYNSSTHQRSPLGGPGVTMTAPWDGQLSPRQ